MNDYRQPDFYRFNQDSLKLVNWVIKQVKHADCILDLGAGSGVVGIELVKILTAHELDLLEVQPEYVPFLEQNISEQLPPGIKARIITSSFGEWEPSRQYDLIVCNPPYFLPDHGEPPQDKRRNIARSFVIDSWEILLQKIRISLSLDGMAFIVVKNDPKIIGMIKKDSDLKIKIFNEENLVFIELSRLNVD